MRKKQYYYDDEDDYLEDDGGLSQDQIDEFTAKGAECFTTISDMGSVKVGIEGKCTILIPNGYGDGTTEVRIVPNRDYIPDGASFLTTVEGEEIGIFSYDCGAKIVKTLSGRYGIYNMHADHGIVIFEKWNR